MLKNAGLNKSLVSYYREKNGSYASELIYHLGCEAGFFSEYNNMILAMLYCVKNNINFSVYSSDANFSYDRGWEDYFLPFCEERGNILHRWFNRRPYPRFKNAMLRGIDMLLTTIFTKCNGDRHTLFDLWNDIRSIDLGRIELAELDLSGDLRDLCASFIRYTWRYNDETAAVVKEHIRSLSLPNHYVGFHIRGGDKVIEAQLQSIDVYIKKAELLSDIRNAFVLTDDYSIIESLETSYPMWTFYTLCQPSERGYYHQSFKRQSKEIIKNQHIKLFASMDILASSDLFVGTFSSNPGMYLGMRMDKERTFSVDVPEWTIW